MDNADLRLARAEAQKLLFFMISLLLFSICFFPLHVVISVVFQYF